VEGLHITMDDFEVRFAPFPCIAHVQEFCVSFIQCKLHLDYSSITLSPKAFAF
jgi:hypothetical protein